MYASERTKQACFLHETACGAYKDLPKWSASDRVLRDKAFTITSNPKYDRYHRGIVSMIYKFLNQKFKVTTSHTGIGITSDDQQLANELHWLITITTITKKFKKQ